MAYFFQVVKMQKRDYPDLGLVDVVTNAEITMVCDHLGARRLASDFVAFPKPESKDGFTPFDQLTESQVHGWIENALGSERVSEMHNELIGQCEAIMGEVEDKSLVTTPPWVALIGE